MDTNLAPVKRHQRRLDRPGVQRVGVEYKKHSDSKQKKLNISGVENPKCGNGSECQGSRYCGQDRRVQFWLGIAGYGLGSGCCDCFVVRPVDVAWEVAD